MSWLDKKKKEESACHTELIYNEVVDNTDCSFNTNSDVSESVPSPKPSNSSVSTKIVPVLILILTSNLR